MDLQGEVSHSFAPNGPLARMLPGFTARPGQQSMALAFAQVIEEGGILAVEAGTGVGKTFAYLVPALLSGERVLVSTATKALQDQLYVRDIPRLIAALGRPVRVALLKGRSSYLCLQRMENARNGIKPQDAESLLDLAYIEAWSTRTRSGDLAELPQLDDDAAVVPLVTSTRENCWGAQCPKAQDCHVNRARRDAMVAELVVVNHHLFFADLNVRESGVAELLPTVRCVVFDEAHQLNDIGVQFLGRQISSGQLLSLARDLLPHGPQLAQACDDWRAMVASLDRVAKALNVLCQEGNEGPRRAWVGAAPDGMDGAQWDKAIMAVHTSLQEVDLVLRAVAESSPPLHALSERTRQLAAELNYFSNPVSPGHVRWLDVGRQAAMIQSPLDIADAMQTRVLASQHDSASVRKSWLFTSATLGHDASLSWFLDTCGLHGAQCLQVQSPFDYEKKAALYVPAHMPKPADPKHGAAVAALVAQGASVLGGRTLVLTTTLQSMRYLGQALRSHFSQTDGMEVLVQGEAPKRELVARFAQASGVGKPACVLVASASFWEGIDVAGDALQMVVIDKLPFSPPQDPVVLARSARLAACGKSAFKDYHLPQAALALKQGAGRLIRSESDRGILVVCDVRLTQMGYGRKILSALPSMRRLENEAQFEEALHALTRPSTTDLCSVLGP
jgi:ATP-dependent DNA helicase DinG